MKNKMKMLPRFLFVFTVQLFCAQFNHLRAQDTTRINLLVAYTSEALNLSFGDSSMVEHIQTAVYSLNEALVNSGVTNHKVELVRAVNINNYAEPSCFAVMLGDLSGSSPLGMQISTLRQTYHADLVALIVENDTLCGLPLRDDTVATVSTAFCVVNYNCMVHNYSLSHMLGHLYGCGHAIDPFDAPSDDVAFPYAHGFGVEYEECYDNGNEDAGVRESFNTIMSITEDVNCYQQNEYGCFLINYFSNPDVSYLGMPTGNYYANNALVVKTQAPTLAGFYPIPAACQVSDSVRTYDYALGLASASLSTGTYYCGTDRADIYFSAGDKIELNPGFSISEGASFETIIDADLKNSNLTSTLQKKIRPDNTNHRQK